MFVVCWATHGYVTKRSPNKKPYARTKDDPDTKVWMTLKAAQKWLDGRDAQWASSCTIEEKTTQVEEK